MDKCGAERVIKTQGYDLLQIRVDQKEPPRFGGYDSLQIRVDQKEPDYDLLRIRMDQKELPRSGGTIYYG